MLKFGCCKYTLLESTIYAEYSAIFYLSPASIQISTQHSRSRDDFRDKLCQKYRLRDLEKARTTLTRVLCKSDDSVVHRSSSRCHQCHRYAWWGNAHSSLSAQECKSKNDLAWGPRTFTSLHNPGNRSHSSGLITMYQQEELEIPPSFDLPSRLNSSSEPKFWARPSGFNFHMI